MKHSILSALAFIIFIGSSCTSSKKAVSPQVTSSKTTYSPPSFINDQTFALSEIAVDETYGYTQKNPIKVGGAKESSGPLNERRFLNALLGPNGEAVTYNRRGSCCAFETPNGFINNTGLLDIYEVKYEGLDKPITLYLNMYDPGELKAPKGFTFKK